MGGDALRMFDDVVNAYRAYQDIEQIIAGGDDKVDDEDDANIDKKKDAMLGTHRRG